MKYYSTFALFKYSWDQVATGFWSKYPNPYSSHVLTDDVVDQSISYGKLITKRVILKNNSLPKWGERFVSGPKYVCVVEESIVDPKAKTLTTYTRNIGYSSIMTVEEKCVYSPDKDNKEWTLCHRQAFIDSKIRGFSYALQKFGLERFKKNVSKSVKGFNFALNRLFPIPSEILTVQNSISHKQKIKDTAKAAKNFASSVIATN